MVAVGWLSVIRTNTVGPAMFHQLYKKFQDPCDALKYLQNKGKEIPSDYEIQVEYQKIATLGARLLFFTDEHYPQLLKQIPDAPPFITVLGNISLLKGRNISIVGSRSSSLAGNAIAKQLGREMVEHGYTVVSGLARGIDRNAHLGAIKATIGVIAGGIDQVYPQENADLYNQMRVGGVILTEAPYGAPPAAMFFHARNRIIAGLSGGTVVVEACKNSGSLITANFALDYGRDVFAVPGCPLDARSYGPNTLIQNGAQLVQTSKDILNNLDSPSLERQIVRATGKETCTKEEVLSLISYIPIEIDELSQHVPYSISTIRRLITELELDGLITQINGKVVMN